MSKKPNAFLVPKSVSAMNRFYIPAGDWSDEELILTGEEAKHCARVMRAREGDSIEIFDGQGTSAICRIGSVNRDQVRCHIIKRETSAQAPHPITLCQAIPKGGNMELIVQKAVELGVSAIQPLISVHTVARPDSAEKKCAKWQRIALEACKQCGQNRLPIIGKPQPFDTWLSNLEPFETRLVASLDKKALHLKAHFASQPPQGSIALLVGPEGDFSAEEYEAAYEAGFQAISLGDIILRVETATIFGLSILRHELSAS